MEGKTGSGLEGQSATGYVDLVLLRSGEKTSQVTTEDILTPFDPELRDDLVAAVAELTSD